MKKILLSQTPFSNTVIIRNFVSSKWKPMKGDPGINKFKKAVAFGVEEIGTDTFDKYEADFTHIDRSHKKHVEEMELMLEKEKFYIVKQKYFKEKYPNFLTWHDKEQIKYLHNSDPEEWTVDKLSEGFPALPEVIGKIITSNWTKKNQNKISNHDKAVQCNWKEFNDGKMEHLPDELVEHLKKFTSRSLNLTPFISPTNNQKHITSNKASPGGFSEIISSYERLTSKTREKTNGEGQNHVVKFNKVVPNEAGTYIDSRVVKDKQLVTLNHLTTKLESKMKKYGKLNQDEQILLGRIQKCTDVVEPTPEPPADIEISNSKYNNHCASEVSAYVKKKSNDLSHLSYPEQITIPRNIRKRSCTYKLNDCFYDYDGQFLYRVPGME